MCTNLYFNVCKSLNICKQCYYHCFLMTTSYSSLHANTSVYTINFDTQIYITYLCLNAHYLEIVSF